MKIILPTITDMYLDLKNKGLFSNNYQPPAQLQPLPSVEATKVNQNDTATNLVQEVSVAEKTTEFDAISIHKLVTYISRSAALALGAQSIFATYKSIKFITVDYPILEKNLDAGLVTQDTINALASQSILLIISITISFAIAAFVTYFKKSFIKTIAIVIAMIMFAFNAYILSFLNDQSSGTIIGDQLAGIFYWVETSFLGLINSFFKR